mgnify:CR=1 FL=1
MISKVIPKLKRIALTLLLVYLGLMAVIYVTQRNFLYFPGGDRPDISTLTDTLPQIISVQSTPEIKFDAWYWPAQNNLPSIVFFHGNGQAYQYWVIKLTPYIEQGYGIFFTDYRGYGGVEGNPSEEGIYEDARAHINALMSETNLKSSDMIFYGESLGSAVATQMATEFPPQAIVYEGAFDAASEVAKIRFGIFPIDLLMKDQFRSIDKIEKLTMPKFFIHGKRDMIIPIWFGKNLYEAAPQPKTWKIIENAGHNDLYDNGAQLHILQFLSTLPLINKE